jgi:outer membrane lipoprotein-sorting protein
MTADEIIAKMDSLMRGKTSYGESEMDIVTPSWSRTIRMKSWSDGTEKFFIHILQPPREKGITFLKNQGLLYQYLPSAEMRVKITPSMMLQSWMGSDFTNDDLVRESSIVNDYTHRLAGKETQGGRACHVIECIPKEGAPVVWGKLMMWVDVSEMLPVREEFFSEKNEKIKVLEFTDFVQANDRKVPSRWTMTPLNKTGHKTVYRLLSIRFNEKIDPQVFTLRNLEKPR